jgi:hypothetical protein
MIKVAALLCEEDESNLSASVVNFIGEMALRGKSWMEEGKAFVEGSWFI